MRNNSVWNYRFFLIKLTNENKFSENLIQSEINYTLEKITEVPFNESPYSYIRGLLKEVGYKFSKFPEIKNFVEKIIELNPKCSYAYSLLLDIYEEYKDKENYTKIDNIISNLLECDYIRKKYWLWRKEKIISRIYRRNKYNNLLNKFY